MEKPKTPGKKIFVCSPYGGLNDNLLIVAHICIHLYQQGYTPFAPHLHFPSFLDETVAEQRAFGIQAGLEFMPICNEVWLFVHSGKSEGMIIEEAHANKINKPVKYVDWSSLLFKNGGV